MKKGRLLMISTDRLIFDEKSGVRARQIEYAKEWEEVYIVVFRLKVRGKSLKVFQNKEERISDNCWIYSTESSSRFFYPFDAISLGKSIIMKHRITEITCEDSSLTAMVGVSLKKHFNLPLEIQIHGDLGSPYFTRTITNKIRLILSKRYIPKADRVRVVSERIKRYVEKLLSGVGDVTHPEIEVRPIFVDKEAIKNAPVLVDLKRKYKQFSRIVLMASRLEEEKNIELAINAWSLVIKSFPTAGLVIVGEGREELKLKKLVVSNSLTKSVIFEKWADKETLYSYYKTADLFINTSLFEGYGMTLVEAQSAGSKIVSTDVGVAKEVGALIVEYDRDDVAKKIMTILLENDSRLK